MCRFIAYIGHPIIIHDPLFKPKNSLIKQSIHARETTEPLNGDGFGLGWYVPTIDPIPAVFKSIQPAWNDRNLESLSAKIFSNCAFAHVRAASSGGVSLDNTHPFSYKKYLFMHNGDIGDFNRIKRHLRDSLSDEMYNWIKGQTDSEHFFALWLDLLDKDAHVKSTTLETMAAQLNQTIAMVENLRKRYDAKDAAYINAVITDGENMIVVRYISNPHEVAATLYYAMGSRYEYIDGVCTMHQAPPDETAAILIASEKLDNHRAQWHEIPVNHMLLINKNFHAELREIGN